jgi:hypothetical protein
MITTMNCIICTKKGRTTITFIINAQGNFLDNFWAALFSCDYFFYPFHIEIQKYATSKNDLKIM